VGDIPWGNIRIPNASMLGSIWTDVAATLVDVVAEFESVKRQRLRHPVTSFGR